MSVDGARADHRWRHSQTDQKVKVKKKKLKWVAQYSWAAVNTPWQPAKVKCMRGNH